MREGGKTSTDDHEIEVLDEATAIRRRPEMYVGPLDNPLVPNLLLREALCCARDDAAQGTCRSVEVRLGHDGHLVVRDDGPGFPLCADRDGVRVAQHYMTTLWACAAAKSSVDLAATTCTHGLVPLNVLSSWAELRIFVDGAEWRQRYERGRPVTDLAVFGATTERGTELTFKLDSEVLPLREFDAEEFVRWVESEVRGLRVQVVDVRVAR